LKSEGQQLSPISRETFKLVPNTSNFTDEVRLVFNKYNCQTCHKPGQSVPGLKLFNQDGSLPVYSNRDRQRILSAVEEGRMPKNGNVLSQSEKNLIKNWLDQ
jgi:hypothetical protein